MYLSNEFTNATLNGNYSVAITGHSGQVPEAGVGILNFDGKEKVVGFMIFNLPGLSFGERSLCKSLFEGKYAVDNNGSGSATAKFTLDDGSISETSFIFVVNTIEINKVAREVFFIQKDLTKTTGSLITFVITRLPEEGEFTLASFKGTFAFNGITQGCQIPAAGIGTITFDGQGKYSGIDILNFPGSAFPDRKITQSPFDGIYTMKEPGIYPTISTTTQSKAIFLITKAMTISGINVAQEYFYIVPSNNLEFTGGNLVISVGKKILD
ncbi:hypothetical protein I8752_04865 [Nostocaceae cyanobacterium CENA369]|uniref:Uncharacterized protein n=1 Tax=Dendronalium phyllosphericum CENA369 TaxID=1725256 RepID=A0A8J7I3P9_9NOST|nr:hypothetical protein [Dendronalium phyllosphericum]MBH8572376.1 hypothetical protein [Dendronalium phyllosphericum CENA369]